VPALCVPADEGAGSQTSADSRFLLVKAGSHVGSRQVRSTSRLGVRDLLP
jgi:hypothetical protein